MPDWNSAHANLVLIKHIWKKCSMVKQYNGVKYYPGLYVESLCKHDGQETVDLQKTKLKSGSTWHSVGSNFQSLTLH